MALDRRLTLLVVALIVTLFIGFSSRGELFAISHTDSPHAPLSFNNNCPNWRVVASPNANAELNSLVAIDALNANDIWAVGFYKESGTSKTLTLHYEGASWSVIPSPNVGTKDNRLNAVAVISSTEVWAVGTYSNTSGVLQTLAMRWNGSVWSVVSTPVSGTGNNTLNGVTAIANNNVWAVGFYTQTAGFGTPAVVPLTERWNGSSWSIVPSPNSNSLTTLGAALIGATNAGANDVWAVGAYVSLSLVGQPWSQKWNGATWTSQAAPSASSGTNGLVSVSAVATNDIWAVGAYSSSTGYSTLAQHWNGSAWSIIATPNTTALTNALTSVSAITTNDVWAFGDAVNNNLARSLIIHWDGANWNLTPSPNLGAGDNLLLGSTAVSSDDVWAVGRYNDGTTDRTLILHYTPPCATNYLPVIGLDSQ